jgi:hypothetical protein
VVRVLLLVACVAVAAVCTATGTARSSAAPRISIVADSVGGALLWSGAARATLARGVDLDLQVEACRKLVHTGCSYQGRRPPSALELIRNPETKLGRVVVLNVGYNDDPTVYADGIDAVMRALAARPDVVAIVWVTLRETRATYAEMNDAIVRAANRWPQLTVAEWARAARGRDAWFADEVHLTVEGGEAFARFLRPIVLQACGAVCGPDGDLLSIRSTTLRGARAGRPYAARLVANGGTTPYRWTVQGLPHPLRVSAAGFVTGRPRNSGRFALAVTLVDAAGIRTDGRVLLRIAPAG